MFLVDIAKVNRDVAYVAMVVYICCKLMFLIFHLFLPDVCCKCIYLDVAYITHICCKCFYLDVVYVYKGFKCFSCVFASVSDAYFKYFICF